MEIEQAAAVSVADAAAVMEADKRQRVQACAADLQRILEAHRCDVVGVPQLTADGRILAAVQLVAR